MAAKSLPEHSNESSPYEVVGQAHHEVIVAASYAEAIDNLAIDIMMDDELPRDDYRVTSILAIAERVTAMLYQAGRQLEAAELALNHEKGGAA